MRALITGSTRGIGRQIGIRLLERGYKVYFNYAHDDSSFYSLSAYLNDVGLTNYEIIKMDLSSFDNVIQLSLAVDRLDVLILNAGTTDRSNFEDMTLDGWNNVMNVNLTNQFFLVQQLQSKINSNGRIIFTSSILANYPKGKSISYAVSKAGVNALIINLVKHFADRNITVNGVAPGFIDTGWHSSKSDKQKAKIESEVALKRMGTPEEVSNVMLSIINNAYINGTVIQVCGGYDCGEV